MTVFRLLTWKTHFCAEDVQCADPIQFYQSLSLFFQESPHYFPDQTPIRCPNQY